ncbi:MAG: glycine--tRNA ligase [Micavibrio aeruginosavorus]|uniref:glycine--tRNA ligase n=1 Tax=Micavibrio aeruginosavorus TaxID=349221 RepID=A0A2W5N642_9BACT|nr:MAG: glycine--tRNA ligase [Micavibrio aeruginosavorus]
MKDIVALCKRRGFVFPASDIYGGINGFWDYGPLGVELKNNLRDLWWRRMVTCPPIGPDGHPVQIVGVDSSIIQNPKAWVASGHVGGFSDPMVDCRETKLRYREDKLKVATVVDKKGDNFYVAFDEDADADAIQKRMKKLGISYEAGAKMGAFEKMYKDVPEFLEKVIGPDASKVGTLTPPKQFNLMFETYVGATQSEDSKAYLRPETAQGIFLNYKNVLDSSRVKVPFGIAQIGKAFRNEVNPRNFIFRSREFEQMELEWFCHPDEAAIWQKFWFEERTKFWKDLGLSDENLQMRKHDQDELSHYAKAGLGTADIEYKFPFTAPDFGELEGVAHRCDFDLNAHQSHSGTKMEYIDPEDPKNRYIPHVIEPAAGLTRGVLAILCEAYTIDPNRPSGVYLNFHPKIAPKKAAILPLTAKDGQPEKAEKLYMELREEFPVDLDIKQNIGKRYARQDEIGTPFCFTIDNDTMADDTVTVRERNTMAQERINMSQVSNYLHEKMKV